jgi:hypothetical protein
MSSRKWHAGPPLSHSPPLRCLNTSALRPSAQRVFPRRQFRVAGVPSYASPQDPRPSASYAPPQAPRPSASYGPPAAREIHGSVGVPPIAPKPRPTSSSGPLHLPVPDILPESSHPSAPVDVRATEAQEGGPNELKGTILPRLTRPSQPQPQPTTTGHDFSG